MKRSYILLSLALLAATAIFSGCESEKKVNYYSDIYAEKPTTIYIAPIIDNSSRRVEKYPKDVAYNNEVNTAAKYLYQTMATPLINHGYYVIGPVASKEIAASDTRTPKQWRNGSLEKYNNDYGIDAVLIVTLHRWNEGNGEWTAYLEYNLRSAKTNTELMHKWVMATKRIPTDLKRDPRPMKTDKIFAEKMGFDNGTAQRCWLVEKVNDYVLRNIPISATQRQFEDDLYKNASATYIKYVWSEDGNADVTDCSIEEYEQGCFIN